MRMLIYICMYICITIAAVSHHLKLKNSIVKVLLLLFVFGACVALMRYSIYLICISILQLVQLQYAVSISFIVEVIDDFYVMLFIAHIVVHR